MTLLESLSAVGCDYHKRRNSSLLLRGINAVIDLSIVPEECFSEVKDDQGYHQDTNERDDRSDYLPDI